MLPRDIYNESFPIEDSFHSLNKRLFDLENEKVRQIGPDEMEQNMQAIKLYILGYPFELSLLAIEMALITIENIRFKDNQLVERIILDEVSFLIFNPKKTAPTEDEIRQKTFDLLLSELTYYREELEKLKDYAKRNAVSSDVSIKLNKDFKSIADFKTTQISVLDVKEIAMLLHYLNTAGIFKGYGVIHLAELGSLLSTRSKNTIKRQLTARSEFGDEPGLPKVVRALEDCISLIKKDMSDYQ